MWVIDSHTGGQPTRVIVEGGPDLGRGPLCARRWRFQQDCDVYRKRCVLEGFEQALEHKHKPQETRKARSLDGEGEAQLIAARLGKPPQGYANWTLRLLARQAVALEIVPSISHETVRRTLKKTA